MLEHQKLSYQIGQLNQAATNYLVAQGDGITETSRVWKNCAEYELERLLCNLLETSEPLRMSQMARLITALTTHHLPE